MYKWTRRRAGQARWLPTWRAARGALGPDSSASTSLCDAERRTASWPSPCDAIAAAVVLKKGPECRTHAAARYHKAQPVATAAIVFHGNLPSGPSRRSSSAPACPVDRQGTYRPPPHRRSELASPTGTRARTGIGIRSGTAVPGRQPVARPPSDRQACAILTQRNGSPVLLAKLYPHACAGSQSAPRDGFALTGGSRDHETRWRAMGGVLLHEDDQCWRRRPFPPPSLCTGGFGASDKAAGPVTIRPFRDLRACVFAGNAGPGGHRQGGCTLRTP